MQRRKKTTYTTEPHRTLPRIGFWNKWTFVGLFISTALTVLLLNLVISHLNYKDVQSRHVVMTNIIENPVVEECKPSDGFFELIIVFKTNRTEHSKSIVNRWITDENGIIVASTSNPGNLTNVLGEREGKVSIRFPCLKPGKYTHNAMILNKFLDDESSVVLTPTSRFTIVPRKEAIDEKTEK